MSNNSLYTEEQVKKMLEVCRDSDLYEHILTFDDILKTQTPIEPPSDENSNKRQMPVDWLSNQSYELFEQYSEGRFDRITLNKLMLEATDKANEMYKIEIQQAELDAKEIVIIKHCAEEATKNASAYSDGYKEGYKRALEYMNDIIQNKIGINSNVNSVFKTSGGNEP